MGTRQRHVIAWHEAGHAIAGRCFGWPIIAATIEPSQDTAGHVEFGALPSLAALDPADRRAVQRQRMIETMIVTLAGPVAQRRAYPRSRIPASALNDHAEVESLAVLLSTTPQGERALLRHAEAEARALVQRDWLLIEAVAAALLDHGGTLTGNEVEAIVAPIEADRAMAAQAHLKTYGLPSFEEANRYHVEQHQKARIVERRHVADAVLQAVLRQLATGDTTPLSLDRLDEAARQAAGIRGLDPDAASAKLHQIFDRQQARFSWRAVEPDMSARWH